VNAPRPLIAIVDDEESVRRALRRLMVSAGFRAQTFSCGAALLASLSLDRPSCVVLDLHMPELSGFELQVQLNGSAQPVPVVVITGHDTPEAEKRVMEAGAIAYLRKPIDDQELLEAVGKALAVV
jgi:FixJ family two-component response regulator